MLIYIFCFSILGCSNDEIQRSLLFNCKGVLYTKMTKDSFLQNTPQYTVEITKSLYVGNKKVEINGYVYDICKNSNTFIVFGNCEKRDLVNFYSFDLASQKLYEYDYFSESFRKKNNFPIDEESVRGDLNCEMVKS